ncbi:MAG: thioredoxin domain-containing protein [Dehalococcoidia bacterium]
MPNRLINETSPYLIQHATNPVNWFPWGEEAFLEAEDRDVPIILSIGYSSCHWCHVMESESFEDPTTADLMNQNFVSIKVDREERPDLDSIYMSAVQSMSGQGGWPLTVFLTPQKMPFFGGTYFPPYPKQGMPSFTQLLQSITDAYKNRKNDIETTAKQIVEHISKISIPTSNKKNLSSDTIIDQAYNNLLNEFDSENGGFGKTLKFPQPQIYEFLLSYHFYNPNSEAIKMVEHSLNSIISGGIYDHIGGGIHRYSTEPSWTIPHFEKMLYDNALIVPALIQCFTISNNIKFKNAAMDILSYIEREMMDPKTFLFYTAQDADTDGEEGKYYTWDKKYISQHLTHEELLTLHKSFDITDEGNFENKNILRYSTSNPNDGFLTENPHLKTIRSKLNVLRSERTYPFTDEKHITSWNAITSNAFLTSYLYLGIENHLNIAKLNTKSILQISNNNNGLFRSFKQNKVSGYAFLEDYSSLINTIITLHEATLDPSWLHKAIELTDKMIQDFYDSQKKVFVDSPTHGEQLITEPINFYDNATPSGISEAVKALQKLHSITNNKNYLDILISQYSIIGHLIGEFPSGFSNWLKVLLMHNNDTVQVCLISYDLPSVSQMQKFLYKKFLPNKVIVGNSSFPKHREDTKRLSPLFQERVPEEDKATVFICNNYTCELPINSINLLESSIFGA